MAGACVPAGEMAHTVHHVFTYTPLGGGDAGGTT
jgi:hypothetical protein